MKNYYFIFIVLITLSLSSGQSLVPVHDMDMNILRYGTNYYILPVICGKGGGITLAPGRGERPCPFDVAQANNEQSNGLPMHFAPANSTKNNIIHESVDLNIVFSVAGQCLPTPVWRVEYSGDERIVSSHGVVGGWRPNSMNYNWFKIEKYGNDYKLVFCPSVCKSCCADIGSTMIKKGQRVLVLNNVPLKVKFKKA